METLNRVESPPRSAETELPVQPVVVVAELLRASHHRRVARRDAQRMAGHGHGLARLALHRLDLHRSDIGDAQGAASALGGEVNGDAGDAEHVADVSCQSLRVPSRLAGEDAGQGVGLLAVGALVEVQRHRPGDLCHVARRVHGQGDVETLESQLLGTALFDVPADQHGALALGRLAEEHAGACGVAVTGLEVGSGEAPAGCHVCSSCWGKATLGPAPTRARRWYHPTMGALGRPLAACRQRGMQARRAGSTTASYASGRSRIKEAARAAMAARPDFPCKPSLPYMLPM